MITLPNIKGLVALGKAGLMAHRSELLYGASITSTIGAVVLAAKGGYEARDLVIAAEMEQRAPLTARQKANLTWHCYVPAALGTVTSLGSTTGLHIVHIKEKKQLAALALMAIEEVKNEANDYAEKLKDIVEDPEKKPAEKVKELKETISNSDGEISEMYLVRDPISGRDIWTNKTRIEEAIVEVGNVINESGEDNLNHFWELAGFGRLPLGDELGWSGEIPAVAFKDDFGRDYAGVRDDGRPWRGFRFLPEPSKGFDDPHR